MINSRKEYTPEITHLMQEIQNSVYMPHKHVLTLIRQLEKLNKEWEDNTLYCFIYYNYARLYSFTENHHQFLKYLKKALYYLLKSDNRELLARSYNLFAIEALKNGCLEIAYEYFSIARSYVEDDSNSLTKAMIEANMGAVYHQTSDPKKALSYLNKSHKITLKHKKNEAFITNLVMILLNKALITLSLGDVKEAKSILAQLEAIDTDNALSLWYLILNARISVAEGNTELIRDLVSQICQKIIESDMFSETARDIKDVCQDLLNYKEYEALGQMLDSIERSKQRLFIYEASLFTQIKIQYYTCLQDMDKLSQAYEERQFYTLRLEEVEKQMSYESVQLMDLMAELRRDKEKAAKENFFLQKKAETDVLTGLPNRYALNRMLETVFHEAQAKGRRLGIGMADINSFKKYNDTYGHQQGDRCLEQVGQKLKALAQKHGFFVSRYGGDEFTFIYEDMDEAQIRGIEKELLVCGDVSLSHGYYCAVPDENSRIWDYLNKADDRLYASKRNRG